MSQDTSKPDRVDALLEEIAKLKEAMFNQAREKEQLAMEFRENAARMKDLLARAWHKVNEAGQKAQELTDKLTKLKDAS